MLTTMLRRLSLLVIVFLVWAPSAWAWSWPVQGPVLEPFAYDEAHPYASGQHRGIDIGADAAGDTVVSPAAGTVSFAGTVPTSGESVTIETPDGYSVTLTHLGSILVSRDATVAEGDAVGTVGPSGTPEVDGPYVHLGFRLTADPNGYVDPLSLLPTPTTQSPPTDSGSGSTASQPTAGAAASPPAPAAAPAVAAPAVAAPAPAVSVSAPATSAPATSAPETSARVSDVEPGRRGVSREARGRAASSRPALQRARSSRRPTERVRTARATAEADAAKPQPRRLNAPASSSLRPIVEAVASGGPTGLGVGHEPSPTVRVAEPFRRPRGQTSSVLLPLVCNGAAALVALAAAFATACRRLRRCAATTPSAQVLHLRRPTFEPERARRAA